MEIWALSGFLGLPQDWNCLQWKNLIAIDWQAFSWNHLLDWGVKFNAWVSQRSQVPKVLMGYSLGGRLALHALIQQPELWRAAIIISTHPGLTNMQERQKRWEQDQIWAKRFETDNWVDVMQAWNAQEVFTHDSFCFKRQESDYQRDQIVKALTEGSLSKQADLRQQLTDISIPILWITGSKDRRYGQLAQTLSFTHPFSGWKQVAQAGHRVPWSQPMAFSQLVKAFLMHLN